MVVQEIGCAANIFIEVIMIATLPAVIERLIVLLVELLECCQDFRLRQLLKFLSILQTLMTREPFRRILVSAVIFRVVRVVLSRKNSNEAVASFYLHRLAACILARLLDPFVLHVITAETINQPSKVELAVSSSYFRLLRAGCSISVDQRFIVVVGRLVARLMEFLVLRELNAKRQLLHCSHACNLELEASDNGMQAFSDTDFLDRHTIDGLES